MAVALSGDPELLFLDEPTTGFDPNARHNAWGIVRNLTALGKTVFLTTHFMDEAQVLADRVASSARARSSSRDRPTRWRAATRCRRGSGTGCRPARRRPPSLGQAAQADGSFEIRADDPTAALHALTGWALEAGVRFETLDVTRPSLEDVYLEITGGEESAG